MRLLTVDEVAERLGASTWRVYELIRLGLLPAVALGRRRKVDPMVLEDWIRAGGRSLDDERGEVRRVVFPTETRADA